MNFDIPIEPHTDTTQALYRLLRQVQNWAEETHPDKGIKSPLEQARYQVAMYGDLLPQIVWWNSVCAQVGALRGLPPGKKQIEQLLEAFRGGPQGKRGKQHGQMVQRRWNELKATGEHATEKETEAAGAVPSAPFPYPAGYQEVGAAVEASTAIPPGNTIGRFVYPKVQGVLQESKPFSFSEINIAGKPTGFLLEDADLCDSGRLQNAITKLRERRHDDPATVMYALISVPTTYQALKVGNLLVASHAETWLRQYALAQINVTTDPTTPLMLKISAEPFDIDTCDDTLVPLEDSGAIPANDWYFPKPAMFGMRDTPETRQGLQQLDELITSFVAGFTGWEQMYHREHGNQLESAEDYEARLQKLVSWLYARLSPRMQAALLKEPWPALPKVEMQPWAPAEDVEVKLDSVVEAPKAPIVGVDWGTAPSGGGFKEETVSMKPSDIDVTPPSAVPLFDLDWSGTNQERQRLLKALPAGGGSIVDVVAALTAEGIPLFEKWTGHAPNHAELHVYDQDRVASLLGLSEPGSEICINGCWVGVSRQTEFNVESMYLQYIPAWEGKSTTHPGPTALDKPASTPEQ